MAPHDYDLPTDYHQRVEEGTMSEWFLRERVWRQATRQDTTWARTVGEQLDRRDRRVTARPETTSVER